MFGDVGHGLIVLILALYFIVREKRFMAMREEDIGDIVGYMWHGRYVLLLMALFSIYCGFIYNDFFGLMADLFGSAYDPPTKGESRSRSAPGAVYPFGLDPAWHHAVRARSTHTLSPAGREWDLVGDAHPVSLSLGLLNPARWVARCHAFVLFRRRTSSPSPTRTR